jgi:hypothetical protein
MSSLIPSGSASGTGSMTLLAPVTNSNQTVTLPDATGNIVVAGANSAITSGTAVASTSGTSIDFNSIPSWVKRITVMFNGVSTNGGSYVLVRFGTSGGIETTNYISASSNTSGSSAQDLTGFIISANSSLGNELRGSCIYSNFGSNIWAEQGSVYFQNSGGSGASSFNSGVKTLSGTLDRVRITTVNGTDTFDAGSINILYE